MTRTATSTTFRRMDDESRKSHFRSSNYSKRTQNHRFPLRAHSQSRRKREGALASVRSWKNERKREEKKNIYKGTSNPVVPGRAFNAELLSHMGREASALRRLVTRENFRYARRIAKFLIPLTPSLYLPLSHFFLTMLVGAF